MLSAYACALDLRHSPDGYPSSRHIIEDIDRVVDKVYLKIFKYWGTIVSHLRTRQGWRNNLGIPNLPQGEKMKKNKNFKKK